MRRWLSLDTPIHYSLDFRLAYFSLDCLTKLWLVRFASLFLLNRNFNDITMTVDIIPLNPLLYWIKKRVPFIVWLYVQKLHAEQLRAVSILHHHSPQSNNSPFHYVILACRITCCIRRETKINKQSHPKREIAWLICKTDRWWPNKESR